MADVVCPVLVVGGGMGGLVAAVEAAKVVDGVVLCSKGPAGRSGSTISAGGIAFPPEDGSCTERHLQNIIECSQGLADYRLAQAMCEDAVSAARFLQELGVGYTREEAGYARRKGMGHNFNMLVLFDFGRGEPWTIMRREALNRRVRVWEGVRVVKVLVHDGEVVGAVGVTSNGDVVRFRSQSVVLAAGGATALYPHSSSAFTTTGDGFLLAYDAGAVLVDMEFVEFTLVPVVRGNPVPVGGAGAFARNTRYLDEQGERILERYDPVRLERAARSTVVRAVYEELRAGGRVFCVGGEGSLAEGHSPGNPAVWRKMRRLGLNPFVTPFEWGIAVHRLLGGARIDERGETSVPGLFAVGECAGGVHGAARLPGHAMLETVVFGRRAGHAAARRALGMAGMNGVSRELPRQVGPRGEGDAMGVYRVHSKSCGRFPEQGNLRGNAAVQQVQRVMFDRAGVVRDAAGLSSAIEELQQIRREFALPEGSWDNDRVDAYNLALVGEMVCRSALHRCETRGTHVRADYPAMRDPDMRAHLAVKKGTGENVILSWAPVATGVAAGR